MNRERRKSVCFLRFLPGPRFWVPFLLVLTILRLGLPAGAVKTLTCHGNVALNPTATEFDAGEMASSNNTNNYNNDSGTYYIRIKSLSADLGTSGAYTKPLTDFEWKLSSAGGWTTITTSPVLVKTDTDTGPATFDMDYKFLLSWANDIPGSYSLTLEYSIDSS